MKLIDRYFKTPLMWDCLFGFLITGLFYMSIHLCILKYPKLDLTLNILTDISNTSFTSTGFVLTILTVLITFKANSKKKDKIEEYESALDLFFQTPLYSKTTNHLKNCIKSLILIAIICYLAKMIIPVLYTGYLFYCAVFCLAMLSFTLIRCMLILNRVLKLQTP